MYKTILVDSTANKRLVQLSLFLKKTKIPRAAIAIAIVILEKSCILIDCKDSLICLFILSYNSCDTSMLVILDVYKMKDNKLENYEAWNLPILNKESFAMLNKHDKGIYLCKFGHLAPSTHNAQPWRFFVSKERDIIYVYLDREYVLPASDVCGRQSVISIGCAIENITIAAQCFGYLNDVMLCGGRNDDVLPRNKAKNKPRFVLLAKIILGKSSKNINYGSKEKLILNSMLSRKVVRAEYDMQRPIPKYLLKALTNVPDGKHVQLKIINGVASRAMVAEFQGQADSYVINSKKFSRELGDWLLPNNSGSGLGMPGINFGLQDDEAMRLHTGLNGTQSLRPEDGLKFSLAGKKGMESSPMIGVLTIQKDDTEHWIYAGRAFEKIFLLLASKNINVAVHAGIVEVGLINRLYSTLLGTKNKIAVLFRAGWVKDENHAKRPHSPRLPFKHIFLEKLLK
jgi:hypothetical protein